MTIFGQQNLQRFRRDEDGNATIEFVIVVPLIFTIFLTAIELGIYAKRQMWLDRGLDIAMREVRLNTLSIPTHDEMKQTICANAGFIPDCMTSVKIEMQPVDPRSFSGLSDAIDCVDKSQPIASQDPPNYTTGEEHDLMLVRACVKFDPIFPLTGLGFELVRDGDSAGQAIMSARSAFVQEPGSSPLHAGPFVAETGGGEGS